MPLCNQDAGIVRATWLVTPDLSPRLTWPTHGGAHSKLCSTQLPSGHVCCNADKTNPRIASGVSLDGSALRQTSLNMVVVSDIVVMNCCRERAAASATSEQFARYASFGTAQTAGKMQLLSQWLKRLPQSSNKPTLVGHCPPWNA